jgi:hypothetical protein
MLKDAARSEILVTLPILNNCPCKHTLALQKKSGTILDTENNMR